MMKKLFLLLMVLLSLKCFSQNHWVPNYHQFPMNMNVIAILEINGMEQQTELLELGVFTGDECRGSCMLHYYEPPVNRYLLFLTTYGNTGDPYTFKLYDHLTQQELDLTSLNEMTFYPNDIIGLVSNPYVFSFTGGDCTVSIVSDPPGLGEVTGGGDFLCGTYCTITATPFGDHTFAGWMLGSNTLTTESSFSFNAVADVELTACFIESIPVYNVSASAFPEVGGVVTGAGEYQSGTTCELTATANEGYVFLYWKEDNEVVSDASSYAFQVESDRSLVACFEEVVIPEVYLINVEVDPAGSGVVYGGGEYEEGALCTLSVVPNEHYRFLRWTEDGEEVSNDSIFVFVVEANRTLVAHLDYINSVPELNEKELLYPNPTRGKVFLSDLMVLDGDVVEMLVYDAFGRVVLSSNERVLDLSGLVDGIYYVRIGDGTMHKVVLRR